VLPLLFIPAIVAEISKWLMGIQRKVARAA